MIISEKGLARCLKRAYKSGGYTLREVGNDLCIYAADWFIRVPWKNLPKKALAVIVEHAGYAYVGASALYIAKDEEPQEQFELIVDEELCSWTEPTEGDFAAYVPMTFKGMQLFQIRGGAGQVFGVKPTALDLLEDDALQHGIVTIWDGYRAVWSGDEELVICKAVRWTNDATAAANDKAIWKALEGVDLHTK